jgi:hypothetical protein
MPRITKTLRLAVLVGIVLLVGVEVGGFSDRYWRNHNVDVEELKEEFNYTKEKQEVQLKWSYDINEPKCNASVTAQSQFFYYNDLNRRYRNSLGEIDIIMERNKWKSYLSQTPEIGRAYKGRGIVYSGYSKVFRSLILSIRFLRNTGCDLRVEVW